MRLYTRASSPFLWLDVTINGQRHRVSTGQTRRRDAEIAAQDIVHKLRQSPTGGGGWRITDALGTYWTEHGQYVDGPDFLWQKIELWDRQFNTDLLVRDLTEPMLMDHRARRRGKGIGPATINRDLAVLRAALLHVARVHRVDVPAISWKNLRYQEAPGRIRFLSREEFARLIAACDDLSDTAMATAIIAAITTGLRKTAMLTVRWRQVDLIGRTITVPHNKGNKALTVRISDSLSKRLQEQRREAMAAGKPMRPDDPVFDTDNFRRRWERVRKAADISDFRWHDLRHTFGSWSKQAGADLDDIMRAMGHSDISVTMRYAHIDPDHHITAFDHAEKAMQYAQKLAQKPAHKTRYSG